MERKSWPWKKRSGDCSRAGAPDSHSNQQLHEEDEEQEMKLSRQRYEERIKQLSAKLSVAVAEITSKDDLVKQHSKVAEEAVSGWEKAEKEAVMFKTQLEAALLQKSGLEDRVAHLDAALKECMRELRHVREEQEHEVASTKEWERVRLELESKLAHSEAQTGALSKALQERAETICVLSEAKARAEADSKVMQVHKEEVEKKSLALRYELQVLSKEAEIRNDERDYNKRMADALSKQQLDNVKKMARMEAECQRLRGLLKKRLPGPAALAQMKLEVDGPLDGKRPTTPRAKNGGIEESEANRMLEMQEETRMLKEALAKRNQELHSARLMCAKTASRLSLVEEQLDLLSRSQGNTKVAASSDADEHTSADSWASALVAELEQFKKGKDEHTLLGSSSSFDLMDDFIEMERLTTTSPEKSSTAASECGVPVHDESTRLQEMLLRKDKECSEIRKTCDELQKKLSSSEEKIKELEHRKLSHSALEMKTKLTDMDKIIADARDRFGLRKTREQEMLAAVDKIVRLVQDIAREVGSVIDLDKLVEARKQFGQDQAAVHEVFAEISAALDILVCSLKRRGSGDNAEFTCAMLEEDIAKLKNEKSSMELQLGLTNDRVERLKVQLLDSEQLVSNLRVQLSSTEQSKKLAENDLAVMATVKAELECKVRAAGAEIGRLHEDAEACKAELEQERARHQEERSRSRQNSFARPVPEEDEKEREIAAAAERLADCQRTMLVLGKQLQTLSNSSKISGDFSEASISPKSTRLEKHNGVRLQSESEEDDQWQMHRSASDMSRIRNARENIRKQEVYWSSATSTSTESYAGSGESSPMETKSSKAHAQGLTRFFLRGK